MLKGVKETLRSFVPQQLLRWRSQMHKAREERAVHAAERVFAAAGTEPRWLSRQDLERMCAQYTCSHEYGYDAASFERRGRERAARILHELPDPSLVNFLDLACMDGMTAAALQKQGKQCWGVDLNGRNFDPRARAAGVHLEEMDAMALSFPNDRFDVVYSFNAFEHFSDPERALDEALRVTRSGGYVYLHFGPLYGSPKGMHAYREIPVPYCQFLFPLAMMNDYLREQGRSPIDPDHCNGWPVQRYRHVWKKAETRATIITWEEYTDTRELELVKQYPSCFRSKTDHFDDLVVSIFHMVFRKR
jgi:SAM-dependent methyltransferase